MYVRRNMQGRDTPEISMGVCTPQTFMKRRKILNRSIPTYSKYTAGEISISMSCYTRLRKTGRSRNRPKGIACFSSCQHRKLENKMLESVLGHESSTDNHMRMLGHCQDSRYLRDLASGVEHCMSSMSPVFSFHPQLATNQLLAS
ncbi:hypothetical protein TWF569_011983 [Orbilia oligospora]|nr:hypothetical protein TWF706_011994 [Orbilia oligospora]KAF3119890.1 hypothetical protein TWF594_011867 [Orbilia oligospora]KAF3154880.1 hypothetical protein TWF569_011983 [Orbilia oligospora]